MVSGLAPRNSGAPAPPSGNSTISVGNNNNSNNNSNGTLQPSQQHPPLSINSKSKSKSKLHSGPGRKKGISIQKIISALFVAMMVVEYFAYNSLSLTTEDAGEYSRQMERLVTPNEHKQKHKHQRKRKELQSQERSQSQSQSQSISQSQSDNHHLSPVEYHKIHHLHEKDLTYKMTTDQIHQERLKTEKRLRHMGIENDKGDDDYKLEELPPWSQILDNFHPQTRDDEPIILGLEYCPAFREKHDARIIGIGPAGLFSTGTNLVAQLLAKNCEGPHGRLGFHAKFAVVQVPWGKHNPPDARFYHQTRIPQVADRTAILPVVAIRHPYTWMSAMCRHSYNTQWKHRRERCHTSLNLHNNISKVPYGFKQYNETHNVTNSYPSLAHMWRDWYEPYFLDDQHNQNPRLMVRHEDLVYRPEKVISKLCECVGGINANDVSDWEAPGGFLYQEKGANRGKGHGSLRSGLLEAVIKYGRPLRNWYDEYTASDRAILKKVFLQQQEQQQQQQQQQGGGDSGESNADNDWLVTMLDTFQYQLFDEEGDPTPWEKKLVRQRLAMDDERRGIDSLELLRAQTKANKNGSNANANANANAYTDAKQQLKNKKNQKEKEKQQKQQKQKQRVETEQKTRKAAAAV